MPASADSEPDLVSLLVHGARDAVATQELLDKAYEQSTFDLLKSGVPAELCPPQYRIGAFDISASTRMEFSRKIGFEITLRPLGLGARLRHAVAETAVMQLTMEVRSVVLQSNPFTRDE